MSFFDELKRRNVIRVGIAYTVAAWLLLQISDLVLQNIAAPAWVMQVIMLLLALGFPLVVMFAWVFEMTPEGIKKEKDVDRSQSIAPVTGRKLDRMIIGVLTVTVAYLLIDKLVLQDSDVEQTRQTTNTETAVNADVETAADAGPSIAVLPFVNMSGDQENEYFSDGLTETLLHMLAQLPELRVAARTSSFAFKGQNSSVSDIAATLGVAHILEGSVQKSGDRVRVTAQLIRADDGFHVWSQNYTRPLEDIFAIQDEIATDVATALDASLLGNKLPDLQNVNTSDLTAYDSYLKGLEQQAIFSYGSLNDAEDLFKQSLARDPDFTDARLALIRNYLLKNGTGVIDREELQGFVEPLIAQVRESDPDNRLARAFELKVELTWGAQMLSRDETETRITELRNMLPLISGETFIRETVAKTLDDFLEQERAAIEVLEAGLLLDPLSANLHGALGDIFIEHERLDEALVSFQRAQQLAPENPNNYSALGKLERRNNHLAAALDWERQAIEIDPQDHELVATLATTLYQLRLPEEGDRWFNRVKALVPGSDVARTVELERALAKEDHELALNIAQSMVADQVGMRRGAFFIALDAYVDLMMQAGRAAEAREFLISVKPETANYDVLPPLGQGAVMQRESIVLMTGVESFETRKATWLRFTNNLNAMGFPWNNPDSDMFYLNLIITGDLESARENYINIYLNKPMATNLSRHKRKLQPIYREIYEDPAVAVRLAELDREYDQLREEIGELMLKPEWNR